MYLSLFLVYYFYDGYAECIALLLGGINSFLFCYIIVIIRSVGIILSSCIFFLVIILMIISYKHIRKLHNERVFIDHFDIGDYPRLFLSLHADLYLLSMTALIFFYYLLDLMSYI